MAKDKVFTAPMAIIKVGGVAIGKMKNIRVNESYQRGEVRGIGNLHAEEAPVLSFKGSATCDFYMVDLKKSAIPNTILRGAQTLKEFTENILLSDEGVQVDIFKLVEDGRTASNLKKGKYELFASISDLLLEADGFDLAEGQISNRNQSFTYLTPVIFRG